MIAPDPFALCERLAEGLPCAVILGEAGPYLSRYTLRARPEGGFDYLHFFHRGDIDRELHNHPWPGTSYILAGGYSEERREADLVNWEWRVVRREYLPGSINVLAPDTFHRVDLLDPRGCWTLFTVGAKEQSWGFWDRDTGAFEPWRENLARRGLLDRHPSKGLPDLATPKPASAGR